MKKIQILKKCAFLFCVIVILMIVVSIMLKYEVEGEKELPYHLSALNSSTVLTIKSSKSIALLFFKVA